MSVSLDECFYVGLEGHVDWFVMVLMGMLMWESVSFGERLV